jgi:transposase-like protein
MKVHRTLKEKKEIIKEAYATPLNVKAAARKYNIQPYIIRRWRAAIIRMEAAAALEDHRELTKEEIRKQLKKKSNHPGSRSTIPLEKGEHLLEFYKNLRKGGHVVTVPMMMVELLRVHPPFIDVPFQLLRLRVRRFCIANRIVRRRTTHAAQNHVYNQEVMADWVGYINREIEISKYSADVIVNMDETNVDFDMSSNYTLEEKGAETVNVRKTGSSERCTILLAVTASGEKLKPFVIFKGVPGARSRIVQEFNNPAFDYPQNMVYTVQQKAWNDTTTMMQWLELVWFPFCREKGRATYLIYDEFSVHLKREVLNATQRHGTQVDIIPGGYTGALQVLDKGVNKPFKDKLRQQHLQWLVDNNNNAKPKRHDVAKWVATAWEQITVPFITNTWHSIGIRGWQAG